MIGAALALIVAGLLICGWACWRLGARMDLVKALLFFVVFMIGGVLFVVGIFLLAGVGLWMLFGS